MNLPNYQEIMEWHLIDKIGCLDFLIQELLKTDREATLRHINEQINASSTKNEPIDGQIYTNAPRYRCKGCNKIHQDFDYNPKDGDILIQKEGAGQ